MAMKMLESVVLTYWCSPFLTLVSATATKALTCKRRRYSLANSWHPCVSLASHRCHLSLCNWRRLDCIFIDLSHFSEKNLDPFTFYVLDILNYYPADSWYLSVSMILSDNRKSTCNKAAIASKSAKGRCCSNCLGHVCRYQVAIWCWTTSSPRKHRLLLWWKTSKIWWRWKGQLDIC